MMKDYKFGDLFQFIRNGLSIKQDKSASGLPISRIETIWNSTIDSGRVSYADIQLGDCDNWLLQKNDILFSHINSVEHIGKCALYEGFPENLIHGMNLLCFRANQQIAEPKFIIYLLRTPEFKNKLHQFVNPSVNQASVSITNLNNIKVSLPPLDEQKRIAAVLDKADEVRAKRRAALEKLDSLLQSVFLDMFGDPVSNPKGWNVEPLGKICDVRDGTHDSPKYVPEGFPLVTSKNLAKGFVDLSEVNLISEKDFIQVNKRSKVDEGDILMPMIGTIGNPVLVNHKPNYAIKNVALIKFIEGSPSNIYIRQLLSGHYFDHIISRNNRGGTQKFISLSDIRSFPILIPSNEMQIKFIEVTKQLEELKDKGKKSFLQSEILFQSLQQRAFAGELFGADELASRANSKNSI